MGDKRDTLLAAAEIATEAGRLIKRAGADASLRHEFKDDIELVTEADLQADTLIREHIEARFPGHAILSEESSPDLGSVESIDGPLWIVDPIDGTVNFAHRHNHSAVSIAYVEGRTVQAAVVHNPFHDETFTATLGGGATLNGEPIKVADKQDLHRAIVATGFPYSKHGLAPLIKRLDAVLHHCADIRRLGSSALDICWLAAGRFDAYYESVSVWDFAAAQLIAREAGARFGHFTPPPPHRLPEFHGENILITNPALFPLLQALLKNAST